jgi:hypothetical protein
MLANSISDKLAPRRTKLRTAIDEPMMKKSNTDSADPNLAIPCTATFEPSRPYDLSDREEPR